MTPRRTVFVCIRPKRFFRLNELANLLSMDKKILYKNAILCGALYRIGGRKLINLELLLLFFEKAGNLAEEIGSKYCQVKDAASFFGVDESAAMQIASDADALFKLRELYLVDVKKMKAYVGKFNYKVNIFDVDAIEEQAKIERRLQRYV